MLNGFNLTDWRGQHRKRDDLNNSIWSFPETSGFFYNWYFLFNMRIFLFFCKIRRFLWSHLFTIFQSFLTNSFYRCDNERTSNTIELTDPHRLFFWSLNMGQVLIDCLIWVESSWRVITSHYELIETIRSFITIFDHSSFSLWAVLLLWGDPNSEIEISEMK